MTPAPFEITWKKDSDLLLRENAEGDFDTAFVGAWLDCPRIAAMTGCDPDTIEFFDPATGRTLSENVPPAQDATSLMLPLAQMLSWVILGGLGLALMYGAGSPDDDPLLKVLLAKVAMAGTAGTVFFLLANGTWPIRTERAKPRPKPLPDTPHHRIVIAHLSLWRALLWLTPLVAVGIGLIWTVLSARLGAGYWAWYSPFLLAGGASCLALAWTRLRLLLFHGGAALWIEAGELVLRSRRCAGAPICGITDLHVGRTGDRRNSRCIWACGEDGRTAFLTGELAERPDAIVARLREILRVAPQLAAHEHFSFSPLPG